MDYYNTRLSTASGIKFTEHYADSDVLSHFWGIGAVDLEVHWTAMHFITNGKSWLLANTAIFPSDAKTFTRIRSNSMWKRTWLLKVYKHVEIFFGYRSWHAQIITSIFFLFIYTLPSDFRLRFCKMQCLLCFCSWYGLRNECLNVRLEQWSFEAYSTQVLCILV